MTRNETGLAGLLARSHEASARDVPRLVEEAGREFGLSGVRLYVADLQQVRLVPLPSGSPGPEHDSVRADEAAVAVDSSLAGLAYRTQETQTARDGSTAWVPMLDGIERIGVMEVTAPAFDARLLGACAALASAATLLVVSKSLYSDLLVERVRDRPMSTQAELLWAFLPPRTIGTAHVTSTAVLEPAYDIGGDAFDHSLSDGRLHLTLLDAMGHDLASGGASAAALAACRSTRRAGGGLADIGTAIDRTLSTWLPERLMTAVIGRLDVLSGELSWVNFGHPPPLLIRDGHIRPDLLARPSQPPLGWDFYAGAPVTEHRQRLQPGDRVLLYSDGVTEGRSRSGDLFGEERLADFVIRATSAGEPAPEALRRLIQSLLHHQDHQLRDDATILLVEWHPDRPLPLLAAAPAG
ncbi:PP2C family protein-serine/threonine phosphatase [Streptomyces sp. NPDC003327]